MKTKIITVIKSIANSNLHSNVHENVHIITARLLGLDAGREDQHTMRHEKTSKSKTVIVRLAPLAFGMVGMLLAGLASAIVFDGWAEWLPFPFVYFIMAMWIGGCGNDMEYVVRLVGKLELDKRRKRRKNHDQANRKTRFKDV